MGHQGGFVVDFKHSVCEMYFSTLRFSASNCARRKLDNAFAAEPTMMYHPRADSSPNLILNCLL